MKSAPGPGTGSPSEPARVWVGAQGDIGIDRKVDTGPLCAPRGVSGAETPSSLQQLELRVIRPLTGVLPLDVPGRKYVVPTLEVGLRGRL